jgi:hypothetical protein
MFRLGEVKDQAYKGCVTRAVWQRGALTILDLKRYVCSPHPPLRQLKHARGNISR